MTFAPSEDSGQPGHPPILIRGFAVCSNDSFKDLSFPHVDSGQHRLRNRFNPVVMMLLLFDFVCVLRCFRLLSL